MTATALLPGVVAGDGERSEECESLIKSKARVKAHGEVFTPAHMVNQMLDLVSEELETGPNFVDATFLEPAAGDGNFLVAILGRKLAAVEARLPSQVWERESLFALASIYGIELLEDNHADAQATMLDLFLAWHKGHGTGVGGRTKLFRAAKLLIATNIRRGNTLTGMAPDGSEIEFSWWRRTPDNLVIREPFTFNSLRADNPAVDLFAALDEPIVHAPCRIDSVFAEEAQ
ncbi:SAM-dependent DNA methyltransferase [Cellulomonas sp. McL0617]|uniref:SAM-dependent DNA methyltransferase n=1 Tax=Cellulomonas sp. McL0617 TaxID=3415675 RepID=UPI003CF19258